MELAEKLLHGAAFVPLRAPTLFEYSTEPTIQWLWCNIWEMQAISSFVWQGSSLMYPSCILIWNNLIVVLKFEYSIKSKLQEVIAVGSRHACLSFLDEKVQCLRLNVDFFFFSFCTWYQFLWIHLRLSSIVTTRVLPVSKLFWKANNWHHLYYHPICMFPLKVGGFRVSCKYFTKVNFKVNFWQGRIWLMLTIHASYFDHLEVLVCV